MRLRASISAFTALLTFGLAADAANAACTRLSFSVNDYGKDGPTKDAKSLLDTYIAKWTAERGIKKYTTGKKDVSCELYLNLIVVDEHTCKAEASVCWDGAKVPLDAKAPAPSSKPKAATAKPVAAAVTTGSIVAPAPVVTPAQVATPTPAVVAPVVVPATVTSSPAPITVPAPPMTLPPIPPVADVPKPQ